MFYFIYRIVADNLDFSLSARIQTSKFRNQSIHWTHHLAIRDRIIPDPSSGPSAFPTKGQCKIADLELSELLPSVESNLAVESDFVVLVTRMVVKFLPAFTMFRDVVIHHIPHQYSNEMARKSDVVRIICKIGQECFFSEPYHFIYPVFYQLNPLPCPVYQTYTSQQKWLITL